MMIFRAPSRKAFARLCPLFLGVFLSACGAPKCQQGSGQAVQIYDLYFGRSVANRAAVSDQEWREFRDHVITQALPNGYTVLDGQGAWMNPRTRVTISESTKILEVALPDVPESLGVINHIRSAWQRRFHQYVVGMTVQSGCGSFSPEEAPR
jgi:hypothetical protein